MHTTAARWRAMGICLLLGLGGMDMRAPAQNVGAAEMTAAGLRDEIPSKVKSQLRSRYPKDRQSAVRKLAAIGSEEAWGMVLAALADPLGQVAGEAQEQLGGEHANEQVWERLYGKEGLKHRDEWVRLRVAEVLAGLQGPVLALDLVDALDKKSLGANLAILRAIEVLQARGALDWGKSPDKGRAKLSKSMPRWIKLSPELAAQGMLTWVAIDPEKALPVVLKRIESKVPLERAGALCALESAEHGVLQSWAETLTADPDAGVRAVALRVLESIGNKSALRMMVTRLETEPREKIMLELVGRLRAMTGYKAGRRVKAWQGYVEDLPNDWRAAGERTDAEDPKSSKDWDKKDKNKNEQESRVTSVGLPTFSDRIVYLMDFSGSIWSERKEGKTRKELLDPIFDKTLDALAEETLFNLGPYTSEVTPWERELKQAAPKRVKDAHRFLDDIKVTGPGDFYTAVQWAKTHGDMDTICVLTDGAPTGGRRWDMSRMVDLLLEENRLRPIRYDIVLVDASKGLTRHWQRLADETGGTLQSLELD